MFVPEYNDVDRQLQLVVTETFFTALLADYTDYNLLDVARKVRTYTANNFHHFLLK